MDTDQKKQWPFKISIQESMIICVHLCSSVFTCGSLPLLLIVRQKSPSRRALAWRLLRLRLRNPVSFPSRVAQDRLEIRFEDDRVAHATERNIFGRLPVLHRAVEWSLGPEPTIAVTREALPFARAAYRVRSRIYSPRLPH